MTLVNCEPCEHASLHGWWGSSIAGTHCRGCHRSWTGLAEGHCMVCHLHFGKGDDAWNAHLDGERHRTLAELTGLLTEAGKPRFKVVDRASGPAVLRYDDRENPFVKAAS